MAIALDVTWIILLSRDIILSIANIIKICIPVPVIYALYSWKIIIRAYVFLRCLYECKNNNLQKHVWLQWGIRANKKKNLIIFSLDYESRAYSRSVLIIYKMLLKTYSSWEYGKAVCRMQTASVQISWQ